MKNLSLTLYFIFIAVINNYAQTKAITVEGDTVYLYNDGTWSYDLMEYMIGDSQDPFFQETEFEIDSLFTALYHPKESKKELTSKYNQIKIRYNDSEWGRVAAGTLNEDAEFAFEHKQKDIWSIVICEETEIGAENILKIARSIMAENTASDVQVLKAEWLTINGTPVLRGVLKAQFSGIEFVFDSYYYSDSRGTTQFTTWTSSNLWERYATDIRKMLNGLIVLPE